MKNKIETEYYIFYFNNINEEFLNTYVNIAEDGNKGLKLIFGKDIDSKIEIFLCEDSEEFKTASDGILPPDFSGSEPIGQSVNGVVHIFKPEEFKPGPGHANELLSYKIALIHEIGHAYYFMVYPDAAKKNDWLNEAIADKSIAGGEVDPRNLFKWPSLRLQADKDKCIDCKTCTKNCPMSLDVNGMVRNEKMENSECILCGTCVDNCKKGVIKYSFSKGI